jgi:hypothetical protein
MSDTNAMKLLFKVVAMLMLGLGIWLLISCFAIDNEISKTNCKDKNLRNANMASVVTSSMLIAISLSFFACSMACDCSGTSNLLISNPYLFCSALLILGVMLIVYGSVISSKGSKCGSVDKYAQIIWISGILITTVGGVAAGSKFYLGRRS